MSRAAGSYVAQLPAVEKNLEILSFRGPIGDNVVQDQRYVEYNHSVDPTENRTCILKGQASVLCLIEKLCPFCSL